MTTPAQYLDYSTRMRARLDGQPGARPSKHMLREAADIACEALASLAEDKSLWRAVDTGAGSKPVSVSHLANSAMLYLPDLLRQLKAPIPPTPEELVASIRKHLRAAEKGKPLAAAAAVDEMLALRRKIVGLKSELSNSASASTRLWRIVERVGAICSIAGLFVALSTSSPTPAGDVSVNLTAEGGSTVLILVPQSPTLPRLPPLQEIKKDLSSGVLWLAIEPPFGED